MTSEQVPCLLLHGFTGGPFEVEPMARYLESFGCACRTPTLPGHDPELKGLKDARWHEWIQAASGEAEYLERQYGTFDLVGFSMGGLIAAYLANRFAVRRLVLLNAAAIYVSPGRFVRELAERTRTWKWSDWSKAKRTPLKATGQFLRLARELRPEFSLVTVPTLVVQGGLDPIVHPRSAQYIFNRLAGEKKLVTFPESKHMICLEPEAERLFELVHQFFRSEDRI
ncbi:alpha/beta hydrolase [Paenibacillus hamazuiensis]|uniref:alpha/beta hydrolase n=1 Tax=Paenibacillus hamazuiensis TaxID=2936508 RepID=UPI00200C34AB|nr:alpha/beta fold hydrolase [Paenibacillus hamazuiensis]